LTIITCPAIPLLPNTYRLLPSFPCQAIRGLTSTRDDEDGDGDDGGGGDGGGAEVDGDGDADIDGDVNDSDDDYEGSGTVRFAAGVAAGADDAGGVAKKKGEKVWEDRSKPDKETAKAERKAAKAAAKEAQSEKRKSKMKKGVKARKVKHTSGGR
jgi:hypothetical protein